MYYTHTNHRGDILAITDSNKQRVATYKYGPWGELISQTGTFDIPFRYAGYYFDSETGLYYLKARYYSPELGRFLTKDTVKGINDDPRTLNLYTYAEGNPVMNTDPDGHWIVFVASAALGAYDGYKFAQSRGYKGWGMAGAIAGGAALGVATSVLGGLKVAAKVASLAYKAANTGKGAVGAMRAGQKAHKAFNAVAKQVLPPGTKLNARMAGSSVRPEVQMFKGKVTMELKKSTAWNTSKAAKQVKSYRNAGAKAVVKLRYR